MCFYAIEKNNNSLDWSVGVVDHRGCKLYYGPLTTIFAIMYAVLLLAFVER